MKEFKHLSTEEALARMENWLIANTKINVENVKVKFQAIQHTRGSQALTDMAFYIQWAYIEKVEQFEILETVLYDLNHFQDVQATLKTKGYESVFQHHVGHLRCKNKLQDVALIAAILGDNFAKDLYENPRDGIYGYMSVIERLADVAQQIYQRQSIKPEDVEWHEYLSTTNVDDWDGWVIAEGARILYGSTTKGILLDKIAKGG